MANRASARPVSSRDSAMSRRHLRETLAMNQRHAADHASAARSGSEASKAFNKAHAKVHKKAAKADKKMLKARTKGS